MPIVLLSRGIFESKVKQESEEIREALAVSSSYASIFSTASNAIAARQ